MNLRGLLKKIMYKDTAKVSRAVLTPIGSTDDYTTEYQQIYSAVPCHLAQYGKQLYSHRDDTSQKLNVDLRLDYDPQYEILPNDLVDVVHCGQTWKLFAGEAFKYPTHTELQCKRRKEGGQR